MTAIELAAKRHKEALENRQQMPLVAGMLEAARAVFGMSCRVLWAQEGDRKLGTELPSLPLVPASTLCFWSKRGSR